MKPDDLVPDLETCRVLKERGFGTRTHFVWREVIDYLHEDYNAPPRAGEDWPPMTWEVTTMRTVKNFDGTTQHWFAAPTLGEILDQSSYGVALYVHDNRQYHVTKNNIASLWSDNPTQAAALLWIEMHDDVVGEL